MGNWLGFRGSFRSASGGNHTGRRSIHAVAALLAGSALWIACGGGRVPALSVVNPARVFTSPEQIADRMAAAASMTLATLRARYSTPFQPALGYSPESGRNLDLLIRKWRLDDTERALLRNNGFVISRRQAFESFALAYLRLYQDDLPVYVSADAILHAWHRAYDGMLAELETGVLAPSLEDLLSRLRKRVSNVSSGTAREDLAEYLAVADSLLAESWRPPEYGSADHAKALFDAATTADGILDVELFGSRRVTDFSQFRPRGHYTKTAVLQRYFRAMMWLGRVDFRAVETQPDASRTFRRRQLDDAVALRSLFDANLMSLWRAMDAAITVFIGMHDSMTLLDMDRFLGELRASNFDLSRFSDAELERRLRTGGYGKQRILGDVMFKQRDAPELQTNASFCLFGQRYSIDGHVFHAVTQDRVPDRELPDALDVGFAALANNDAAPWLGPDLAKYSGQLAQMRTLIDAQRDEYWKSSLYGVWLWSLRGLSPDGDDRFAQRPSPMRSEPWARRLLNTALGSWSELRHDTILYAKQSYSAFILCKFPDVYVDPYPEFYERLRAAAVIGRGVVTELERGPVPEPAKSMLQRADAYFVRFDEILGRLQKMAEREVAGEELSGSDCEFVNDMIQMHQGESEGCGPGPVVYDGWYVDLLNGSDVEDPNLTVADVHTSEIGILEVGKGLPRAMIVTVDTRQGPRSFIGAVYSFHQFVTQTRWNDEEWSRRASATPDVPWLKPLVAYAK